MLAIARRFHVFEFTDQPWFKGVFREAFMDCLDLLHRVIRPYRKFLPHIKTCADHAGSPAILDTCSGGGEQLYFILKDAQTRQTKIPQIVASDLFPQTTQYQELRSIYGKDRFDFIPTPTNLMQLPNDYRLVSMFTALHHFRPEDVRQFFKHVVAEKDGVFLAEFSERNVLYLINAILGIMLHVFAPFFCRNFSFKKLCITTILPIIPLIVVFDGFVSGLRTYTLDELRRMFLEAEFGLGNYGDDYAKQSAFEIRTGKHLIGPFFYSSYFYAYRKPKH